MTPVTGLGTAGLIAALLLAASTARADDPDITVTTREGAVVQGRLVSETERGFLIATPSETRLIPYGDVAQVQRGSSPSGTPAASAPPEPERHTDVGFGGGAFVGRTADYYDNQNQAYVEVGPQLQVPIEFPGETLALRLVPELTAAFVAGQQSRQLVALAIDVQLRIHFSDFYSVGVGGFAGGGLADLDTRDGLSAYGTVGVTVVPMALRWGDLRQHEVEASLVAPVDVVPHSSGLEAVRLAFSYLHHF